MIQVQFFARLENSDPVADKVSSVTQFSQGKVNPPLLPDGLLIVSYFAEGVFEYETGASIESFATTRGVR